MIGTGKIPEAIRSDMRKARRLCVWTLLWIGAVTVMMYLVMGQSQAMKSAFIEDVLSLIPSITFLTAAAVESKSGNDRFPFGFRRFNSIAFVVAATALLMIGSFIAFEALMSLLRMEHPSIGEVRIFGQSLWLGWLMLAALFLSAIPPVILGRLKLPVAERLQDKVLFTDAETQKADWQTAVAGMLGVLGIGLGFWWADSAAALFISLSITRDGWARLRTAVAELADGAPRSLKDQSIADDAQEVAQRLRSVYPRAHIRIREVGRYMVAEVVGEGAHQATEIDLMAPSKRKWRLAQISYVPDRSHRVVED